MRAENELSSPLVRVIVPTNVWPATAGIATNSETEITPMIMMSLRSRRVSLLVSLCVGVTLYISVIFLIASESSGHKLIAPDQDAGSLGIPIASHSLASRGALCNTPLVFLEKICCLALIMGGSRDSGQGLGFDRRAS